MTTPRVDATMAGCNPLPHCSRSSNELVASAFWAQAPFSTTSTTLKGSSLPLLTFLTVRCLSIWAQVAVFLG